MATGGLHEDGLADTVDGLGGGRDPERRLQIMRDSRIGAFGALALLLSLALRGTAITALATPEAVALALLVTGTTARAAMLGPVLLLSSARTDGLGASLNEMRPYMVLCGVALATLVDFVLLPWRSAFAVILAAVATMAAISLLARRLLGGYTGDVLGAVEQVSECVMLSVLVAMQ
jgi:adenosylcobinamide-GDP ribazoletransferase